MNYITRSKTRLEKIKFGLCLFYSTIIITAIDFTSNILRNNLLHDMNFVSWIYYVPASLGHASLFALILFLIFYLLPSYIFRNYKIAAIIYCVTAILLQALIVLDGFVFSLYRFHINGFILELVLGGGSEIFVFDFWVYVKFFMFLLLVAVIPYIISFFLSKKLFNKLNRKLIIRISTFFIICILILHLGHVYAAASRQTSIQKSATAMPLLFPLTANSLLKKLGLTSNDKLDNINYNESSSDIIYPIHPLQTSDSIPNYNILYIAIDSWNPSTFDSINTPNIYKLSKKGHYFNNHYSSSNGTRGSLFGMFFGLSYTYEKEFIITKKSPLFIDQLINKKYDIQVFPSASFTSPPFHEVIFRRVPGINTSTNGATPFDRDNKIAEMTLNHISSKKAHNPFFAFTFFDLPHAISIPKEYRQKFRPSWDEADYMKLNNDIDRTPFFNLYKNCVYHTDSLIGKILDKIETEGLMDKTIIIITGDHGQEFNENKKNYWGHSSNFSKWQTHVPLIIYYPRIEGNKEFSHVTTHYDISPTIMKHFLGVANPYNDFSMGYDLYDTESRYPYLVGDYINYGFIFENMIISTNPLGTMEVTDKNLNELPRSAINITNLQKAIEKKNMFYKKNQ